MGIGKSASNLQTTIAGVALGGLLILQGNGFQLPSTKQDWTAFIGGLATMVLGTLAKDGSTGSAPGA